MQIFVKAVYAEFGDTIGTESDPDKEKSDCAEGEEIFCRCKFIGEFFDILRGFHIFIITRQKKKGKPIAWWKVSRKNNFFTKFYLL